MATDSSGLVWVSWCGWTGPPGGQQIEVYASYFDGVSWAGPIQITHDPSQDVSPLMAVDGAGRVWIVWNSSRSGVYDIYSVYYDGSTWSDPIPVSSYYEDEANRAIAVDQVGDLWVLDDRIYWVGHWDNYSCVIHHDSTGWNEAIPVAPSDTAKSSVAMVTDGQGRLWVACFTDSAGVYTTSYLAGTWSPFARVTGTREGDYVGGTTVDTSGRPWLSWFRPVRGDTVFTYSTFVQDGEWMPPVQVNPDTFSAGGGPMVLDGAGRMRLILGREFELYSTWCWPPVGIAEDKSGGSGSGSPLRLEPSFPNPFRERTSLQFRVWQSGRVTVGVYNLLGEYVITLVDTDMNPGLHLVAWDGKSGQGARVPGGVYFCRLEGLGGTQTGRMVLVD